MRKKTLFDDIEHSMMCYRSRSRDKIPPEVEMRDSKYIWDDAPDPPVREIPVKRLTAVEARHFETFGAVPRTLGISLEDRFGEDGENEPLLWLKKEPARVGSTWRKNFKPEDHVTEGQVGRLVG